MIGTTLKVLCYTDTEDNTKGTLLVAERSDMTTLTQDEMADKIQKVFEDGDWFTDEDPMEVYEVCRQLAYIGASAYKEYEFYFENVPYIG